MIDGHCLKCGCAMFRGWHQDSPTKCHGEYCDCTEPEYAEKPQEAKNEV